MPYQESNNGQDVTPEEYLRLLAIQRRMRQSQGGTALRISRVDATFPSLRQQMMMQNQMQLMPPQRMMEMSQGSVDYHAQGRSNREEMRENMFRASTSIGYASGDRGVGHQMNRSRSFGGAYQDINQFDQGLMNMEANMNTLHASLSRSIDPRLTYGNSFSNENMMASSFPSRNEAYSMNDSDLNGINLSASAHSDDCFPAGSSLRYRHMSSSPPAKLPINSTMASYSIQDRDNTIDLTDELVQASAGILSPVVQGKRRRLNSDEIKFDKLAGERPASTASEKSGDLGSLNQAAIDFDVYDVKKKNSTRCPSPFTRRTETCSPLTPLDRTNNKGFCATDDSPMGQTPIMFAKFFLGTDEGFNAKAEGIPLPPLYQSDTASQSKADSKLSSSRIQSDAKPSSGENDSLLTTPYASEPLCLPPKRKKKLTPLTKKKVATKKSTTRSPKAKSDVAKSPSSSPGSTDRHGMHPLSNTIFKLSAEIRNQVSSPGTIVDNDNSSPEATDSATESSSKGADSFSPAQFATLMEASQFSQQSIHDWDKKFGLRRVHSKTMRESARSRKNVLELLRGKCLRGDWVKNSTSTASTFPYSQSLSGTSFMSEENGSQNTEFAKPGEAADDDDWSVDEKSDENANQATLGHFQVATKDSCMDNKRLHLNASASTSTPGISNDDEEESMCFGSIGSFDHEGQQIVDNDAHQKDDNESTFSYSSKILEFDIEDDELTKMFRRASLDPLPEHRPSMCHRRSSLVNAPLPEPDYKQCFAKSA